MKEIIHYEKENWDCPIEEFFNELHLKNKKMLSKALWRIENLKYWFIWYEDIKFIKDKLYELRIKESSNISRIFYFTYEWNKIILLYWIIKKYAKLKNKDIDLALKYKDDFLKKTWKI